PTPLRARAAPPRRPVTSGVCPRCHTCHSVTQPQMNCTNQSDTIVTGTGHEIAPHSLSVTPVTAEPVGSVDNAWTKRCCRPGVAPVFPGHSAIPHCSSFALLKWVSQVRILPGAHHPSAQR